MIKLNHYTSLKTFATALNIFHYNPTFLHFSTETYSMFSDAVPYLSKVCGRWGETDQEKGLVDLFPVEPTDEAFMPRRP